MIIGFDASRAFIGEATGTENYSLNLLRALAKIDRKNSYRVYVRGHAISNIKNLISKKAVWPVNFKFVRIRPYRLWTQVGLALETWRNPVDILFVPAHTLPILRNRRVKTVVTIHDLGVEYLPGYHQFPQKYYLDLASRYAVKHADAVIAVSKATKGDLIKRYGTDHQKVYVVPEGVDMHFFKPQPKTRVSQVKSKYKITGNYVLCVGTVQPRKNLEMLIRAFEKAVNRQQLTGKLYLVVVGKLGWNWQGIVDLPKKLGISKHVKFLGYVKKEDLPSLYSGASVFAFPSLFEGFGLPILESLSCLCPVIASDIPPHREIFRKLELETRNQKPETISEAMILVKPNDINSWYHFLYQYITLYNKRRSFISNIGTSTNFRHDLVSFYDWEKSAKLTLKIFYQFGLK